MKNVWIEKIIAVVILAFAATVSSAYNYQSAADNPLVQNKIGYLSDVESISFPSQSRVERSKSGAIKNEVVINALGQEFHLILEEFNDFRRNTKVSLVGNNSNNNNKTSSTFYKGKVVGTEDSWVRVEIDQNNNVKGTIHTPYEVYVIEPKSSFVKDSNSTTKNESVMYRLSDVGTGLPENFCGVEAGNEESEQLNAINDPEQNLKEYRDLINQMKTASAYSGGTSSDMKELKIGFVADYKFYLKYGANSVSKIESLINQIDGIYRNDLKIALNVTNITVYTTAEADPFSSTTNSYTLLREAGTYLFDQDEFKNNGVNHLISGKNFDSNIIGLAYVDTVCSGNRYATSITQSYESFLMSQVLVSSHEIGHNLGATHDTSADGKYIMWPSASSIVNLNFSDRSQSQIVTNKSLSCFRSSPDLTIELIDDGFNTDNSSEIMAVISNNSSFEANQITFSIDIPSSVNYIQYSTDSEIGCSYTLGQFQCEKDILDAKEEVYLTLRLKLSEETINEYFEDANNIDVLNYSNDINTNVSPRIITATLESNSSDSNPYDNSDSIILQIPDENSPNNYTENNTSNNETQASTSGGGGSIELLTIMILLFIVMISCRNLNKQGVKIRVRKTNQTNLKK